MVNIIGRTQEEKSLGKKTKELKDISRKLLTGKNETRLNLYSSGKNSFLFQDNSGASIFVFIGRNYLNVERKEYFDIAFELARAYEEHTGEKWTLKKEYED